jgi:hypothetical protein
VSAFIDIGPRQKMFLVENDWLVNLRSHISKMMAVYDENPSSQKIKKRVQSKEEVIEDLAKEFCSSSGCLDN